MNVVFYENIPGEKIDSYIIENVISISLNINLSELGTMVFINNEMYSVRNHDSCMILLNNELFLPILLDKIKNVDYMIENKKRMFKMINRKNNLNNILKKNIGE